jgi:FtsP/CotA-like multicopper oxidase with cupredoxin domain
MTHNTLSWSGRLAVPSVHWPQRMITDSTGRYVWGWNSANYDGTYEPQRLYKEEV